MPIPSMGPLDQAFYNKATWELKFIWWPRRCALSNELMWLKLGYKGTAGWSGPSEPAYEYKWHSEQQHLIWKLKGN